MEQLDREVENIENDPYMSDEEKREAIREAELAAADWEQERQMKHEEIDRQYGY